MSPLWSDDEPGKPSADAPPRRHAQLYEAEYAKQLKRLERIRKAVGSGEVTVSVPRNHDSWDEPPEPALAKPERESGPEPSPAPSTAVLHSVSGRPQELAPLVAGDDRDTPESPASPGDLGPDGGDRPPVRPAPRGAGAPAGERGRRPGAGGPRPGFRAGLWIPPQAELPAAVAERRSRHRRAVLAAVVAILSLVALAIAVIWHGGDPQPAEMTLPSPATDLLASGGRLWVAAPQSHAVWVLDAGSGQPARPPIRISGTPARLIAAAGGAWAADTENGAVVRVRAGAAARPIRVGPDVSDVALAAGAVWTASAADGTVRVLEPGRAPRTLDVGGRPVALAADARSVFVAGADGTVTRLDARRRRIAGSVRLGGTPIAVALAGDAAWVADAGRGTVRRIALGSSGSRGKAALVAGPPVAVGREPVALAAGGRDVYVVCRGDRTLVRVDARSGAVSARVRLEAEPAAVALDLEHVWIAAAGRSVVMRVDRRRLE